MALWSNNRDCTLNATYFWSLELVSMVQLPILYSFYLLEWLWTYGYANCCIIWSIYLLPCHDIPLCFPIFFLLYNLQTKLKSIESQLNEALNASDARSTIGSESASVISSPKITESTADSSSVTKRLEEELAKRDALIEVDTQWILSSL